MSRNNGAAIKVALQVTLLYFEFLMFMKHDASPEFKRNYFVTTGALGAIAFGIIQIYTPLWDMKISAANSVEQDLGDPWEIDRSKFKFPEVEDDHQDASIYGADEVVVSKPLDKKDADGTVTSRVTKALTVARDEANSSGRESTGDESVRLTRKIKVCHRRANNCVDRYNENIVVSVEYSTGSGDKKQYNKVEQHIKLAELNGINKIKSDFNAYSLSKVTRTAHSYALNSSNAAQDAKARGWGIYANHQSAKKPTGVINTTTRFFGQ